MIVAHKSAVYNLSSIHSALICLIKYANKKIFRKTALSVNAVFGIVIV